MKTSLNNSRYLDPKYVTQNDRKHSPKPYLSPSPAPVSKNSDNSPYKSNTQTQQSPNISSQQKKPVHSLDENDSKLVSKLITYRQNLVKKLHSHTLIYNIQPLNKCIKHGCYFSVYNKNNHRLLCAQCFTNIQKQKSQKKIVKILTMNSPTTPKQKIESPKFNNIHKHYLPIQKSKQSLEEDVQKMKGQIQKQNTTLEGIESILYEGFNEQKKQLQKSLAMIDQRYEEAFNKLKQSHQHYRQNLLKRFNQEWTKHQCVIKQLGLIRSLIKDYLTQFSSYAKFEFTIPHSFAQYSPQRKNKQARTSPNEIQNKEVSFKKTVYQHIIYSQLSQSLKFSHSEFLWSKQKHKNYIKQVSMTIQKGIAEIMQKIQKLMSKKDEKNIKT